MKKTKLKIRCGGMLAILVLALALMVCPAEIGKAVPLGTAFTYQGRLIDANNVADGLYDFQFELYDKLVEGTQQGSTLNVNEVDVIDGYFTVELDFGAGIFDGDARWLEIGVRPGELSDPNTYTVLSPRQEVTPTPYALYAETAGGDSDWMLSGNDMYSIPSGYVGIGTGSPETKLHIYEGLGGASSPVSSADPLAIESSDSTYINIITRSNKLAGIMFSDDARNRGMVSYDHGSDKMRFKTAGAMRAVIDSSGQMGIGTLLPKNKLDVEGAMAVGASYSGSSTAPTDGMIIQGDVGIGTASPKTKLHIYDSPGGGSNPNSSYDPLAIESSDHAYINIITPSDKWAGIMFSDDVRNRGIVSYDHKNDMMYFYTAGTPQAVIDSSGRMGIGTSTPTSAKLHADAGDSAYAVYAEGGSSYSMYSTWDGSSLGSAIVGINTGTGGDAIQAIANGSGRSAIFAKGSSGVDYAIYAMAYGATYAGYFNGDVKIVDSAGQDAIILKDDGLGSAGQISVYDTDETETVRIVAAETSTTGAEIALRKADGTTTITLDADYNGDGRITTQELVITGGSDLSEQFDVDGLGYAVEPGMVVSIDPARPGKLQICTEAYDNKVVGIISGAGGIKSGMMMGQRGTQADGAYPVALSGRVYCWADASNGSIEPGNLLTTSGIPGHAMKVSDHTKALGAIIGKAMTSLEQGRGLVLVLVNLQ